MPRTAPGYQATRLALATADRTIKQMVNLSHSLLQNSYENAKNGPTFLNLGQFFDFFRNLWLKG
jgi:hypothetical protein